LNYDYEKASLNLKIVNDGFGVDLLDAEILMNNNERINCKDLKVRNNRIDLVSGKQYFEKDIKHIIFVLRSWGTQSE